MDRLTWEVLFDSKFFEHRPEFSKVGRALQMQGRGGVWRWGRVCQPETRVGLVYLRSS